MKGPFGLGVKLSPAHLSTTHGGDFTLSFLIAEYQAGKLRTSIFVVFCLTRPEIESGSTASAADALSIWPLITLNQWFSTCRPWPTEHFAVGTEHFDLKKLYLHDELFLPWHSQKACRGLRWMASWLVFFYGDHLFSAVKAFEFFFSEITCFRPEKPFEFWWKPFFLEITCFRPEEPFQSNSRLIKVWVGSWNILEQYFERWAKENFPNENGLRVV